MTDKPPAFEYVPLRGTYYRGNFAIQCARSLMSGDGLIVVREPSNSHDCNAIQVFYEHQCIGYVGREYACDIAPWMDQGWYFMTHVMENYVCGVPTHVHLDMKMIPIDRPNKEATTEQEKVLEHET